VLLLFDDWDRHSHSKMETKCKNYIDEITDPLHLKIADGTVLSYSAVTRTPMTLMKPLSEIAQSPARKG
jgi:hypothetical protein